MHWRSRSSKPSTGCGTSRTWRRYVGSPSSRPARRSTGCVPWAWSGRGDRGKIRLRRVFREFAELLCRATIPYREAPGDYTCEESVNERCSELPVRFVASRIEDQTDPALTSEELADIYRSFLSAQLAVAEERFGPDVAGELLQQVRVRINPRVTHSSRRARVDQR